MLNTDILLAVTSHGLNLNYSSCITLNKVTVFPNSVMLNPEYGVFFGGGGGISLFERSMRFPFFLLIDFFSPILFVKPGLWTKLIMKMCVKSRDALCIIYPNLFSLLSCN